ncbi:MAG: 16S rRNA (cytosine(967)-C(5))-methyltransferase RsmB [Candidatus Competibacterales bacterium]|nr:16S rRNA (cytosine(967)-C(5))-methyltransferase RsmB [Candidatus Competibacterales bacterium]
MTTTSSRPPQSATQDCRAQAAGVVAAVVSRGRALDDMLEGAVTRAPVRDAGLLRELCYGTLRWYLPLEYRLQRLLHRPLPQHSPQLHALLMLGLYQLQHLRIPDYAAVAATVAAAEPLGLPRYTGLINAVLRESLRRRETLDAAIAADPETASAHPGWLLQALREDWPQDWPAIVAAGNSRPPMALRLNPLRTRQTDYLTQLAERGLQAHPVPGIDGALVLEQACDVADLPGFAEGLVSVQDPAAQFTPALLDVRPGMRVLDACAAPGGKTGALLERVPDLDLLALDLNPDRLERVASNLERLGLQARLVTGDACKPPDWWDGRPFDRILLDAPCSGTGVIRRHPDIKLLRRATDIDRLAVTQRALLEALWPLLRTGGCLLYVTCSVLSAENRNPITAFCAAHPEVDPEPLAIDEARVSGHGHQILPGAQEMDGFFYARLRKL